jgi:hypothetical protein
VTGHHRIPVMWVHLTARDRGFMDPSPAPYLIRIKGHLGATVLSAFPGMKPQRYGTHTVLTGLLDRPALYGVLAEVEALGLDLLEVRQLTGEGDGRDAPLSGESPGSGDGLSPG